MVKIRLTRVGAKNQPYYRIVVVEARSKRNGRFLEIIGHFDPRHKNSSYDAKRLEYWQKTGAQLTQAVRDILEGKRQKTKENKKPKRKRSKDDTSTKAPAQEEKKDQSTQGK